MKMIVPLVAALLIAGPAAAQSSHAADHPAASPPTAAIPEGKGCPKMDEMSASMEQMKQMHQQHQGMKMEMPQQRPGMNMPQATPPSDGKTH